MSSPFGPGQTFRPVSKDGSQVKGGWVRRGYAASCCSFKEREEERERWRNLIATTWESPHQNLPAEPSWLSGFLWYECRHLSEGVPFLCLRCQHGASDWSGVPYFTRGDKFSFGTLLKMSFHWPWHLIRSCQSFGVFPVCGGVIFLSCSQDFLKSTLIGLSLNFCKSILCGVCWPWACKCTPFNNFGKFCVIISLNAFPTPSFLLFFWIPSICMLGLLKLFHRSLRLYSFFSNLCPFPYSDCIVFIKISSTSPLFPLSSPPCY